MTTLSLEVAGVFKTSSNARSNSEQGFEWATFEVLTFVIKDWGLGFLKKVNCPGNLG